MPVFIVTFANDRCSSRHLPLFPGLFPCTVSTTPGTPRNLLEFEITPGNPGNLLEF